MSSGFDSSVTLGLLDKFKLGADIFSPSQTCPHQHSPASLIMHTPEPQQRLSGAFINQPSQEIEIKPILGFL
jgi:hypothetical protein